jgi:hypothetical protein
MTPNLIVVLLVLVVVPLLSLAVIVYATYRLFTDLVRHRQELNLKHGFWLVFAAIGFIGLLSFSGVGALGVLSELGVLPCAVAILYLSLAKPIAPKFLAILGITAIALILGTLATGMAMILRPSPLVNEIWGFILASRGAILGLALLILGFGVTPSALRRGMLVGVVILWSFLWLSKTPLENVLLNELLLVELLVTIGIYAICHLIDGGNHKSTRT